MGHELAHVLCGRIGQKTSWNLDGITEKVQQREQEYEADYAGFRLGRGVTIDFRFHWTSARASHRNVTLDLRPLQKLSALL